MAVIRASARTEHSVLAREIAVWPNLIIPYHSGPGGLSEVLVGGRGIHSICSPALVRYSASISLSAFFKVTLMARVATYVVSSCSPQRFDYCS